MSGFLLAIDQRHVQPLEEREADEQRPGDGIGLVRLLRDGAQGGAERFHVACSDKGGNVLSNVPINNIGEALGIVPPNLAHDTLLGTAPAPVSIWVSENYTRAAVGGTGALKIGADFLKRFAPDGAAVYISDPSWENHRALFETAG